MTADIPSQKALLRQAARERRAVAYRGGGPQLSAKLKDFTSSLYLPAHALVAGYTQRGSELDPLPLLNELYRTGHLLALPVVTAKEQPLVFRAWKPGDPLVNDAIGITAPLPAAPEVEPDAVLVPLIAFDGRGHRLGTGAGFYDRTLPALRAKKPDLVAIGLAFAVQQELNLPIEPTDATLDAVMTERGVVWFKERKI